MKKLVLFLGLFLSGSALGMYAARVVPVGFAPDAPLCACAQPETVLSAIIAAQARLDRGVVAPEGPSAIEDNLVPLDGLCAICYELLQDPKENKLLKILPNCKHVFHQKCIDQWLAKNGNCPLCRASVPQIRSHSVGEAEHHAPRHAWQDPMFDILVQSRRSNVYLDRSFINHDETICGCRCLRSVASCLVCSDACCQTYLPCCWHEDHFMRCSERERDDVRECCAGTTLIVGSIVACLAAIT